MTSFSTTLVSILEGQRRLRISWFVSVGVARAILGPQPIIAGELEQVSCLVPLNLPPCAEMERGATAAGICLVVGGADLVVADQQVMPTSTFLDLFKFGSLALNGRRFAAYQSAPVKNSRTSKTIRR